jgi:hypothetical protein
MEKQATTTVKYETKRAIVADESIDQKMLSGMSAKKPRKKTFTDVSKATDSRQLRQMK